MLGSINLTYCKIKTASKLRLFVKGINYFSALFTSIAFAKIAEARNTCAG